MLKGAERKWRQSSETLEAELDTAQMIRILSVYDERKPHPSKDLAHMEVDMDLMTPGSKRKKNHLEMKDTLH